MRDLLEHNMARTALMLQTVAIIQRMKGNAILIKDQCDSTVGKTHRIFGRKMSMKELSDCTQLGVTVLHNWRSRGQLADKLRKYRKLIEAWE